jgi:hypothetical protein
MNRREHAGGLPHSEQTGKGPAHGLRGNTEKHPDLRDAQGGTYGTAPGKERGEQVVEHPSAHEAAQTGADVRSEAEPKPTTMPEGLERGRAGPLNKTTGRRPATG